MKKLLILAILPFMISCQDKKEQQENNLKKLQEEAKELKKSQIDFFMNAIPKYFSATTVDGKLFNSPLSEMSLFMNKFLVFAARTSLTSRRFK